MSVKAAPGHRRDGAGGPGRSGGAHGNERLTAMTGAILLALLAAEGVTIVFKREMMTLHFFIGMLLVLPGDARRLSRMAHPSTGTTNMRDPGGAIFW